jgi:hypothetical protein
MPPVASIYEQCGLKRQDHVPYPSNDQKMSLTECFRRVLTMVLDGFQFLEFWGNGDPGWVRTVRLKRNHAPSRDNLRSVWLKITRSCALPFKWSKDVGNGVFSTCVDKFANSAG